MTGSSDVPKRKAKPPRAKPPAPPKRPDVHAAPQPIEPVEPGATRVVVIDDHPMVRERLADLVNAEPGLTVVGEADDVASAMALIERTRPDVALVDVDLKNSYGVELIRDLKTRHPRVRTLVVSMHEEPSYVERALRAGARGFVSKREPSSCVLDAIRRVLEGELYVTEPLAGALLMRVAGLPPGSVSAADRLTRRETEVLQLLGQGLSMREIARRLKVNVKTVEAHRIHIRAKLNLSSGSELLRYAIRMAQGGEGAKPEEGA